MMTRLLVSVRSRQEAQIVLDAGVDLVDVKEPHNGSLGAASSETIDQVVQLVAKRVPVSAALGELIDFKPSAVASLTEVDYVKLGLAGCGSLEDWPQRWQRAWETLPPNCGRIAVAYADWRTANAPDPISLLAAAQANRCVGLLVDTYDKHAGDLFGHMRVAELELLSERARDAGLLFVLAGGLKGPSVSRARDLQPDYVAVRGAVCGEDRNGPVVESLVRELVIAFRNSLPVGVSSSSTDANHRCCESA